MSGGDQSAFECNPVFSEQAKYAPDWRSSGPQKIEFGPLERWRAIRVVVERGKAVTAEARRLADIEDRLSRAARCSSPEERAFIMHEPARQLSWGEMLFSILKHARASNLDPRAYALVWMLVDIFRRRMTGSLVSSESNQLLTDSDNQPATNDPQNRSI